MYNALKEENMKIFLILFVSVVVLLLSGCSKATAFTYFSINPYYEKAVSNIQQMSLMKDQETKALIHVVYLNDIDPLVYNDGEYFYISLFMSEKTEDEIHKGLFNPKNKLMLRSKRKSYSPIKVKAFALPLEIHKLDENNALRLSMPIHSVWNEYYLVKFETMKRKKIKLIFENDQFGKAQLAFVKEE